MNRKDTEKTRRKKSYVYWKARVVTLRNEYENFEHGTGEVFDEIMSQLIKAWTMCELLEFDRRMEIDVFNEASDV